jgi:hypothetical protein
MSTEFWSDDHEIKIGFSGSGIGSLLIKSVSNTEILSEDGSISISGENTDIDVNTSFVINCANLEMLNVTSSSTDISNNVNCLLDVNISGNLDVNGDLDVDGTITTQNISGQNSLSIATLLGGDIDISASGVNPISGTKANINISSSENISFEIERSIFTCDSDSLSCFKIVNESTNSNSDGLEIELNSSSLPNENNNWVIFSYAGARKGSIRGSSSSTSNAIVYYPLTGDGAADTSASLLSGSNGDVQYTSGNSDFAEWIKVGDPYEWCSDPYNKIGNSDQTLNIEEGTIVYVKDGLAWRTSGDDSHCPMVVTNRALMIGNYKNNLLYNPNYSGDKDLGVIVSFSGQVPVITHGFVSSGDYLIPVNGENYCIGVKPKDISFDSYRASIGRAWSESATVGFSKVVCAVGVK